MYYAWGNDDPFIHDHPHHGELLACRCFKGNLSLSNSALDVFMNNLDRYSDEDLDCVKFFPVRVKSHIARMFFSSHAYISKKNVNYKKLISVMLHDKMREVDLTQYTIDDDIMKSLGVCKNLEVLHLDGRANNLLNTVYDEITYLSPDAIIKAVANFPELIALRIQNCDEVTDDVLIAIAASCPKMQKLNFCNSRNITDVGLKALMQLRNLMALDISCSKVTDTGLTAFLNGNFIENLEDIRLNNCREIKEFDFNLFASKCKSLTMFSCRGCTPSGWSSIYLYCDKCFLRRYRD